MRFAVVTLVLAACSSSYADGTRDAGAVPDSDVPDASPPTDSGVATDAAADAVVDAEATPCLGALDCERVVFVTSSLKNGDRGGLLGADAECQALADASSSPRTKGRAFRAWLSTTATAAASRVPHGTKPYRRTDGVIVQNDYASILSLGLLAPINIDENGAVVATSEVWTGTKDDGSSLSANCGGWEGGDGSTFGRQGIAAATNAQWTDRGANLVCSNVARLYCIEN